MIEKEMRGDIRQGDREKALLNALRKIKGERVRLNSGTTPPLNLVDFLNYVICIYKHLNGDIVDQ